MSKINVFELKKPEPIVVDQRTEILRQGARKLLAQALEAEIEQFISQYAGLKSDLGRQRIVRNGLYARAFDSVRYRRCACYCSSDHIS